MDEDAHCSRAEQIEMEGAFTADHVVVRVLLQKGHTYEQAVKLFEPYQEIQQPDPATREALRQIAERAVKKKKRAYIFVNNRSEWALPPKRSRQLYRTRHNEAALRDSMSPHA